MRKGRVGRGREGKDYRNIQKEHYFGVRKGQYGCMKPRFLQVGKGEGLVLKPKPRFNTRIDPWCSGLGRVNSEVISEKSMWGY